MSNIVEQRMFVFTSSENNNNKFWEITLYDNNECLCRWGRIDDSSSGGQSKKFPGLGKHGLESKVREKTGKGYREIAVIGKAGDSKAVSAKEVHDIATDELAGGNPELKALVKRLAEANRHQILQASGGKMDLDLTTGLISTPVGVVTTSNIDQARIVLDSMEPYIKKKDFDNTKYMAMVDNYLMLIPQKVGSRRGWHHDLIPDIAGIARQSNFLDQLESSVDMANQQLAKAKARAAGQRVPTFNVELKVLEDKKKIAWIKKFYQESANSIHASRNLKPVRFYEVRIDTMAEAFENDGAKLSNIWQLWHGTRVHNVLSIMKSGLIIPKSHGSIAITGRMFGDGLYFSDQSTKSLNYSYGYWDGGAKDNNCFMFLADVAMGNFHVPSGPSSRLPVKGSDSTYAQAQKSGVMNNEMIVYRTGQANLRYLIEFSDK